MYQQILENEEHFEAIHFQDGNTDCQKACVNTSSWVFDDGVHVSMQLSVSACMRVGACKRFTVWIEMLTFLYEKTFAQLFDVWQSLSVAIWENVF